MQLQQQSARVRETARNPAAEDRDEWGCVQLQQQGERVIGAAHNLGGEGVRIAQSRSLVDQLECTFDKGI